MSKKGVVVLIAVIAVVGIVVYYARHAGKPESASWSFTQSVTSAKVKPDATVKIGTLTTAKGSVDLLLRLKDGEPVSRDIPDSVTGLVFQSIPGVKPVSIEVEGSSRTPRMMRNCRDIACAVSPTYDCAVCKMRCPKGNIVFDCYGMDCGPVYHIPGCL